MKRLKKTGFNTHTAFFSILILFSMLLAVLLAACATASPLTKQGLQLYQAGEYDKAVAYFQKELVRRPKSTEIKTMLFRAKLKSYYTHLSLARKYREAGKKDEAIKEYKIALGVFPLNKKLEDEFNDFVGVKKAEEEAFESTIVPPVTLNVDPNEKVSIKLPGAPIKKIFQILGKSFKINFIFDKDFRDFVYGMEVEDTGFYQILNQLCMVAGVRYRILDSSSVLIYQDTSIKRRTFDLQGVKVFYLANVKADDAKKVVLTIFREERVQIQEDANLNSLIIKGSSDSLMEIEKFIRYIDKGKSEVEIEVQILEVNRNIINAMGADYGSTFSAISAGLVDTEGKVTSSMNVNDLKNTNFFITIPSAALLFLESDDNTKIISKPNLRGVDGEEIRFMVGEERPVPQTSFQSVAAGGVSTIPMTTYTYKNVGVDIKITPYIHSYDEVTLKVKLTLNFVTGVIDQFPVLGKRELESVIRLKEGETNIIGGFIRDEVRGSLRGFPGLSRLPLLGRLFGNTAREIKQSDLIFSMTPRVIRRVDITDRDLETIWIDLQTVPQGVAQSFIRSPGEGRPSAGRNTVNISPSKRRVPVNTFSYFTIRVNSSTVLSSFSASGSVSGGKATIEELRTDFIKAKDVKVFQNYSGDSFDVGFSNLPDSARSSVIGQLKIKFDEKGKYTLSLDNINAISRDNQPVTFDSDTAEIEVY